MVTLIINGKVENVDGPADMPLLWALRDVVGLTGTKFGCGMALCGPSRASARRPSGRESRRRGAR